MAVGCEAELAVGVDRVRQSEDHLAVGTDELGEPSLARVDGHAWIATGGVAAAASLRAAIPLTASNTHRWATIAVTSAWS